MFFTSMLQIIIIIIIIKRSAKWLHCAMFVLVISQCLAFAGADLTLF